MLSRYPDPQPRFTQPWSSSLIRALEERDRKIDQDINVRLQCLPKYHARLFGGGSEGLIKAVNAAAADGGGWVFAPSGVYEIPDPIAFDADNVVIEGEGMATIIRPTGDFNAFTLGNASTNRFHVGVRNLQVNPASPPRTSGWAISADHLFNFSFQNIWINGCANGVELKSCTAGVVYDVECYAMAPATGVGFLVDGGNDHYFRDTFAAGYVGGGTQTFAGYQIKATGGTWMDGCGALATGTGCLINPGNSQIVSFLFTSRCAFDTCLSHCWDIAPTGTGVVYNCVSVADWAASSVNQHGLSIGPSVLGYSFSGLRALNNGKSGVALLGGSDIVVDGAQVCGNSASSSGSHSGVLVDAGISGFRVVNTSSRPIGPFANTQKYGMEIKAGASNWYTVALNDFHGNLTGGLLDGGAGVNKVVGMNL